MNKETTVNLYKHLRLIPDPEWLMWGDTDDYKKAWAAETQLREKEQRALFYSFFSSELFHPLDNKRELCVLADMWDAQYNVVCYCWDELNKFILSNGLTDYISTSNPIILIGDLYRIGSEERLENFLTTSGKVVPGKIRKAYNDAGIKTQGDSTLFRHLNEYIKGSGNLSDADKKKIAILNSVANKNSFRDCLERSIFKVFSEEAPKGKKWEQILASYVEARGNFKGLTLTRTQKTSGMGWSKGKFF